MRKFSRNLFCAMLCVVAFSTLCAIPRLANANITITPTIVTIEGRQRYADVNLINTSNETKTYELSWRFFKMAEGTGIYQAIPHSVTDFDLTKSLIYSPKRVTLAPSAAQKVRLALRLSGEPPAAGDYRAHLEFKQVPKENEDRAKTTTEGKGKSSVGVGVNVAFSIPVIYRVGEADTTISMGDVTTRVSSKHKNTIEAIVPVTRSGGSFGLAGDLTVYYTPKGGKETRIGQVKNANIFPEITSRIFEVTLNTNNLQDGSLRIVLKDSDAKKNIIYAEKIIPIGH